MFSRLEKALRKIRFAWWFPTCAVVCSALVLFPLTVSSSDLSAVFYVLVTVPSGCLLLLITSHKNQGRRRSAALSTLAIFILFTAVLFTHFLDTRDAVRWFFYGPFLKADVLAQPAPPPTSLKHIEWEGWGFAGNDTTVYLVFDPNDALAPPAITRTSGKFGSLPCEVYRVRRREKSWYTVQFYTNTAWDDCGDPQTPVSGR